MKESVFQFSNPVLTELEFGVNRDADKIGSEQQVSLSMEVQVNKKSDINEAEVLLKFKLGDKDASTPFYVKATEQADFRWGEELSDEVVEQLLNQNAPSLLVSYLRPIITQITASSPYDAFNIPFINFTNN